MNSKKSVVDILEIYSDKLNLADKALSRNLYTQFFSLILTSYSFLWGGEPLKKLANQYLGFETDLTFIYILIASIYLFLFARLGYLIRNFINIRFSCKILIDILLEGTSDKKRNFLKTVFDTANILEPLIHTKIDDPLIFRLNHTAQIAITLILVLVIINNVNILIYFYLALEGMGLGVTDTAIQFVAVQSYAMYAGMLYYMLYYSDVNEFFIVPRKYLFALPAVVISICMILINGLNFDLG